MQFFDLVHFGLICVFVDFVQITFKIAFNAGHLEQI